MAVLHKYGIKTTLPFSKYASPIFAQKEPNGKLRLLVDLRKINNLISDDYINNNHPVSTLVDAAQHLAGKKGENQIPEVKKGFTTLFGIFKLLQNLCPKTVLTPCSILQDAEK